MSSIIYNGHEIQDLIINGNQAQLWLNGQKLYPTEEPVDPYNPLGLPPFTIRCKFKSGYTPTMGNSQTLVDSTENVWDIYKDSPNWADLFRTNSNLLEVLGANTSSCTRMRYMFAYCSSLTTVPLFDTSSCTDMSYMFKSCTNVQSGALALYQQASTQATPPSNYSGCFESCGSNTVTGRAELAQIPTSWGGTMSA
jgi:surface protein